MAFPMSAQALSMMPSQILPGDLALVYRNMAIAQATPGEYTQRLAELEARMPGMGLSIPVLAGTSFEGRLLLAILAAGQSNPKPKDAVALREIHKNITWAEYAPPMRKAVSKCFQALFRIELEQRSHVYLRMTGLPYWFMDARYLFVLLLAHFDDKFAAFLARRPDMARVDPRLRPSLKLDSLGFCVALQHLPQSFDGTAFQARFDAFMWPEGPKPEARGWLAFACMSPYPAKVLATLRLRVTLADQRRMVELALGGFSIRLGDPPGGGIGEVDELVEHLLLKPSVTFSGLFG